MDIKINKVWFDNDYIYVKLNDERIIGNPIKWFKNLAMGTPQQREQYKIVDDGEALRWDNLDEDLSVDGFIRNL